MLTVISAGNIGGSFGHVNELTCFCDKFVTLSWHEREVIGQ
jgi:hypothetical protein